jgi:SsrA-binding protein
MNKQEEEIRKKSPVNIRNKKASFEYFFIETLTAGIVLTGTEIKSIRAGKASLVDSYCLIINGEMWVRGMSVSPYFYGSYNNHEQKRDRKLLLTKREINKLQSATKQTGYTIVPLLVFLDEKGRAADTRTPAQKKTLLTLLHSLKVDYPDAHIVGHCELESVHKACPCFPVSTIRKLFE